MEGILHGESLRFHEITTTNPARFAFPRLESLEMILL